MIIGEVIWHAACTHFSVIQLVVDSTMYNTQWNVYFWGGGSWPLRWWQLAFTSFFSDEVICTTYIVMCTGCSWEASVLLSSKVLRHIQTCFPDISCVPHIFNNRWWMSIGVIPFTFINCFTLHTSTFIRVSSRWCEVRTVPSSCCLMTQDSLRLPVTWWNLWSDDATAHATSYCLIFWKFLVCEIQGK